MTTSNIYKGRSPNFLVIMSDEHAPMFSSTYGHPLVSTPSMDRLAEEGSTFNAAYCNSPLCVPSRLSFMTGRYVSRCKGWDNATPLPSDTITWPYLLRSIGYDAVLSGKMHLIGPDKLHGFKEQLSYDPHGGASHDLDIANQLGLSEKGTHPVYSWRDGIPTADNPWPDVRVAKSGRTPMIDADDAIEKAALQYLSTAAKTSEPFALCVGFVAPHFPFIVPEPYFSMYYPHKTDLPADPHGHVENLPPAAQRLRQAFGFYGYSNKEVRRARAAYYGLVTYLDEKIGRLLDALEEHGLAKDTVVIHTSDHGESLGEHGLWRKMNFYEQSSRVPLQIRWPGVIPSGNKVNEVVSLVDVVATILDVAGFSKSELDSWRLDGDSVMTMISGPDKTWKDEAFVEHLAHGTDRARAMIRQRNWKLSYSHGDQPELEFYDLDNDPGEYNNLAFADEYKSIQKQLLDRLLDFWIDPDALTTEVLGSQDSRLLIRNTAGDDSFF